MNSIYRRSARIAFFLLVAVAGAASTSHSANAQNFQSLAGLSPYTKYQTFDTEHFHFIYEAGYFEFTKRAALHIEHAHEILQPIFKWTPRQKTHILIADHSDAANGLTSPALRIGIVLIATPPDAWLSTSHTDDWIKLLVFHEYTHFLNIDPTTEWMEAVRIFFGDAVRPNGLLPIWMLEGLAVYYETKTSRMGRGRSPYYEGILRAFVNEGRLGDPQNRGMTLDRLDGDFPYFPGGESPYLFGYHLWDQLAKDQTLSANPDDTIGELSIRSSHRVPYFLEGNLSGVTGKNWIDYWDSFVAESKARFAPEIEKIKSRGETPHAFVTHSGYSAVGGVISPNGKYLAYTESTMTEVTKLVLSNLDTHEKTIVREKTMGIGMAFTPDSKFLIYSSLARFQTYDLFSDLFAYNLETGSSTPLTHGLRAKDPTLSPDGKTLAFVSSQFATHELKSASLSLENGELKVGEAKSIYPAPSFAILGNPKFISDQEVVFSSQEIGQTQSDLKIASLNGQVRTLLADGAINRFPIFDSGKIDFVSSKNGIENVYQISLEKNSLIKPLTNVITGVEFPFVSPKHELYASLLTSDGFEIAKFEAETSVNSAQNLASPANSKVIATPSAPASIAAALTEPKLDIKEESAHDYSAFGTLAPRGWAPVTYLTYGTYAGYSTGGYLLGFDDTGKQQYFANFAYNFKPETLDGSLDYTFSYFRPIIDLILSSSTTDIATDLTQSTYRKANEVLLNFSYPVFWTYSSLKPSVYAFSEWNRIYDIHTRAPLTTNDFEYSKPLVPGVGAAVTFSDAETSRLGFMPQSGNVVSFAAEDRVNVDAFSVVKYLAAYQHFFDLGNTAVLTPQFKWLESTYPTGFDVSYARVEGRHSYDVFDQGQILNLNRIGIRGYTDTTHLKKAAGVVSLDFDFPISRSFLGYETLPVFFKQIHGFVFGEGAYLPSVYIGNSILSSFGGGITIDTTLLVRAPVSFSLQYQNGTRKDFGGDSTVFFSMEAPALF